MIIRHSYPMCQYKLMSMIIRKQLNDGIITMFEQPPATELVHVVTDWELLDNAKVVLSSAEIDAVTDAHSHAVIRTSGWVESNSSYVLIALSIMFGVDWLNKAVLLPKHFQQKASSNKSTTATNWLWTEYVVVFTANYWRLTCITIVLAVQFVSVMSKYDWL